MKNLDGDQKRCLLQVCIVWLNNLIVSRAFSTIGSDLRHSEMALIKIDSMARISGPIYENDLIRPELARVASCKFKVRPRNKTKW